MTTSKDSESNTAITTSPTEVKVENGTASATVKTVNMTEAIRQAAEGTDFTVEVAKVTNPTEVQKQAAGDNG